MHETNISGKDQYALATLQLHSQPLTSSSLLISGGSPFADTSKRESSSNLQPPTSKTSYKNGITAWLLPEQNHHRPLVVRPILTRGVCLVPQLSSQLASLPLEFLPLCLSLCPSSSLLESSTELSVALLLLRQIAWRCYYSPSPLTRCK